MRRSNKSQQERKEEGLTFIKPTNTCFLMDLNISELNKSSTSALNWPQSAPNEHPHSNASMLLVLLEIIYYNVKIFFLPTCVVLGTINNLLVLGIFHTSRAIASKVSRTACKYYLLLAIGDLACIYFMPFLFFAGISIAELYDASFHPYRTARIHKNSHYL